MPSALFRSRLQTSELLSFYQSVRETSLALGARLSDADAAVQSMPDASPAKWHLAHTTWFFETIVLRPYCRGYRVFDAKFNYLFNSYYNSIGARHPRPRRGLLTRPSLDEIYDYRAHVDEAIAKLVEKGASGEAAQFIELGCHHEQQHQELLLTDILHLFSQNPLEPAYKSAEPLVVEPNGASELAFVTMPGGLVEVGHDGEGFAFDCEGPRHQTFIEPFGLADRLVTNREWIEFIEGGGYRNPLLWLSEGWAKVQAEGWAMPLYWDERDKNNYWTMTLRGAQPVDPAAPVCHINYFEADAYATWAGRRLPNEFEWEHAARDVAQAGNFLDSERLRPRPAPVNGDGPRQIYGDVWEWTRSAFSPYPRFKPAAGAVGEYNGKFMCGQFVLRGGSCVTPASHMRATYRNFFPPDARWQFSGLRLAADA
jgi:ergothioneine biosynthesis protein EgtB